MNEFIFLTFPFKKLWGKSNYFCCAFVLALHILYISCDIVLNIFSVIIIIMLDILAMRRYVHIQPYSIIRNTKCIVGKLSTATLLVIYTAWKTENLYLRNYMKWPSIHSVVPYFPNTENWSLGYESAVILLNNVVLNYVSFCFFAQC